MRLEEYIRDIPDFPKKGVLFKDITPLLKDPAAFSNAVDRMLTRWRADVSVIAGLDSRGFIFGAAMAKELGVPFVPVRKKGKLPYKTYAVTYDLEYGTDTLEVHVDAFDPLDNVLIVDDLLATGGTAKAAASLVELSGARVLGFSFLIELLDLNGRFVLEPREHTSLMRF